MPSLRTRVTCLASLALATGAFATPDVRVVVTGEVEFNAFQTGTYAGIAPGAPVTMTIDLDSSDFLNSPSLPGVTRGYRFYPSTFSLTIGGVTTTLRTTPQPPAYFAIRNDDPRADGFFLSQGTDIPTHIPLQMTPNNYGIAFMRTFNSIPPTPPGGPDPTLSSVDLLGALGSWAFDNLSVYHFAIQVSESSMPMLIAYQTITISQLGCPCLADVDDGSATGTCDNGVDISDLLYFLALFDAGNLDADFDDGSSTGTRDGGVDISDLLYFLLRFDAGC